MMMIFNKDDFIQFNIPDELVNIFNNLIQNARHRLQGVHKLDQLRLVVANLPEFGQVVDSAFCRIVGKSLIEPET